MRDQQCQTCADNGLIPGHVPGPDGFTPERCPACGGVGDVAASCHYMECVADQWADDLEAIAMRPAVASVPNYRDGLLRAVRYLRQRAEEASQGILPGV